jgi:hypothetical protein
MMNDFSSVFGTLHGIFLKIMEILVAACMFAILQNKDNVSLGSNFMFFGYILGLETLIFIPCYLGGEIYITTEDFISDLFSCEWTEADLKYKKMFIIFMEYLKKPLSFNALLHRNLNLEKFTEVRFNVFL